MKKITIIFLTLLAGTAMADSLTSRIGTTKPTIGSPGWGPKINNNFDILDSSVAVPALPQNWTGIQTFVASGTVNNTWGVQTLQFTGDSTSMTSTTTFVVKSASNTFTLQQTLPSLKFSGDSSVMTSTGNFAWLSGATKQSGSISVTSGTVDLLSVSTITVGLNLQASGSVGTPGQVLSSQGTGTAPHWVTTTASAGGSDGQLQYNSGGSLAGVTVATYSFTNGQVTVSTPTAILGTQTNNDAAPGYVGQSTSAYTGATAAPTSGQWGDLGHVTLTPGDWMIYVNGAIDTYTAGTTRAFIGAGKTSGNNGPDFTNQIGDDNVEIPISAQSQVIGTSISALRASLSSTTTVFFKVLAVYSVQPNFRGRITALRVR